MNSAFFGCSNIIINATDAPDLSKVTDMTNMFAMATSLNQPIGFWDVSSVTDMYGVFQNASSFNQDISTWDVSNSTSMSYMFHGVTAFNQEIGSWDVSSVTNMNNMFSYALSFHRDLNTWDVSNVGDMSYMFTNDGWFNQDIRSWDVSSVTDMSGMFSGAFRFNQDISSWDVSNVTDMNGMFLAATSFNKDLSHWDVSRVENMTNMFSGITLSTPHYDSILAAWSELPLQSDVVFDAGNSYYRDSVAERTSIISMYNWTINDLGLAPAVPAPSLSSFIPASSSFITSATPTITFTSDVPAACRLSLSDEGFDDMSDDVSCSGGGTTSHSCVSADLGSDGSKVVYIACSVEEGNSHSSVDNIELSYILDTAFPEFGTLPGETSVINLLEGQEIATEEYDIRVRPSDSVGGSGIDRVEFYVDGTLLCTETEDDGDGVYECVWDTTQYHSSSVRVVVYDGAGHTAELTRDVVVNLAGQLEETGNAVWLPMMFGALTIGISGCGLRKLRRLGIKK